jgi:hypothetical protein
VNSNFFLTKDTNCLQILQSQSKQQLREPQGSVILTSSTEAIAAIENYDTNNFLFMLFVEFQLVGWFGSRDKINIDIQTYAALSNTRKTLQHNRSLMLILWRCEAR